MNYKGVIIEESLSDKSILGQVKILETKVEEVIEKHKTPWVTQWSLHTVDILEVNADEVAEKISISIDTSHKSSWYADFKNDKLHYIIFPNKIFKVDLNSLEQYKEATNYGVSIGIPEYQVDFAPEDKTWER